jgi:hypothetical protein
MEDDRMKEPKADLLKAKIDAIQEKHKQFFETHPSKEHDQYHTIYSCILEVSEYGTISVSFVDVLLPEIQEEILAAYKETYGSRT